MSINRYELVTRHNPNYRVVDYKTPLSVGNGEIAINVDVTGMQTLYDNYNEHKIPLCTMSQWGWHTTPVSNDRYQYHHSDLAMTEYSYAGRKVTYAVENKPGNEEVYHWLRKNPHRFNLARIGLKYNDNIIPIKDILHINQNLNLYEGIIHSEFELHGVKCIVETCCHYEKDTLAFRIQSDLLVDGKLEVCIEFPYGSPDISGSNWEQVEKHQTNIVSYEKDRLLLERILDRDKYYVGLGLNETVNAHITGRHQIVLKAMDCKDLSFSVTFTKELCRELPTVKQTFQSSSIGWKVFWETGGVVDLHKSKDPRALELERRIVLSQYVLAIHSCGSIPPQETGLLANSWHGKSHLEMYLWHLAYLPLWSHPEVLEKSFGWYLEHLEVAKENAARNGFKGAKWPKQVGCDGIDSPSPIATLLIWQQPHIIYMLELVYQYKKSTKFLERYWEIVKETADYMTDLAVFNEGTGKYDLVSPLIPAQEAHDPLNTKNPTFEVEYWHFTLQIAVKWAKRLNKLECTHRWDQVAANMADLPHRDGLYLAHEQCPTTFEEYNKDHPSMLAAFGLIGSVRIDKTRMHQTMQKVKECWDYSTTWGWDFAMIAMTATRLSDPEFAIDMLLMDTPNNYYGNNGHNIQKMREDLPSYLPGNGSLLLAVAMMAGGYKGSIVNAPGFPKNGLWEVEYEDIHPFPY